MHPDPGDVGYPLFSFQPLRMRVLFSPVDNIKKSWTRRSPTTARSDVFATPAWTCVFILEERGHEERARDTKGDRFDGAHVALWMPRFDVKAGISLFSRPDPHRRVRQEGGLFFGWINPMAMGSHHAYRITHDFRPHKILALSSQRAYIP